MKKDNVIPNDILERKRKDSTIEFRSVANIFDEFLKAEGVVIPVDSNEEEGPPGENSYEETSVYSGRFR